MERLENIYKDKSFSKFSDHFDDMLLNNLCICDVTFFIL